MRCRYGPTGAWSHLLTVEQIDVGVVGGVGLCLNCDPLLVAADGRKIQDPSFRMQHLAFVLKTSTASGSGSRRKLRIALVGHHVEGAAVRTPATELRFQLVARRQVLFTCRPTRAQTDGFVSSPPLSRVKGCGRRLENRKRRRVESFVDLVSTSAPARPRRNRMGIKMPDVTGKHDAFLVGRKRCAVDALG